MWFNGTAVRISRWDVFSGSGFGCSHGAPRSEYLAGSNNVVWAAVHNQFFALLAMPKEPVAQIVARPVSLPPFPNVEPVPAHPRRKAFRPHWCIQRQPLRRTRRLSGKSSSSPGRRNIGWLARIGDQFQNQADLVMQFGKFTGFLRRRCCWR